MVNGREREKKEPPDRYEKEHISYTIHIKDEKDEIEKMAFAKMVFVKYGSHCKLLKKISRNTMRMDCDTMELANEIIEEQPFNGKKCFIPYHAKYVTGVLRDIYTNLTSEEIIQMFENKFNKVFRMYRYQNNERQPTKSVRVIMEADELPDEVTVYPWTF